MITLAFFDFDGTITRHDTLISFARHAVGRKKLLLALIRSLPAILLWKIGVKSNSSAKKQLFSYLYRGMRFETLKAKAISFINVIDKDLRTETMKKIHDFQVQNSIVVIVSASMEFWIEPWARKNGIKYILATIPEVNQYGIITGEFASPNCHGAEKVVRIKSAFPDFENYETFAYGDSSGDEPMLAFVNHGYRI